MEFPLWLLATFLFLLGCCIGSFLNVVIWRLPNYRRPTTFAGRARPLTLSFPPSHCPHCQNPIRARHNIPVLGYFFLRGRCHDCRRPISPRYPLVEFGTGLVFLAVFLHAFDALGHAATLWGLPGLTLQLFYISAMLATAAIDADTFEIPLILPHLVIAAALATSFFGYQPGLPAVWAGSLLGQAAWGGAIGLAVSLIGLRMGILPRSFTEPRSAEEREPTSAATPPPHEAADERPAVQTQSPPTDAGGRYVRLIGAGILAAMSAGAYWYFGAAGGSVALLAAGLLVFLSGVLPQPMENIELSNQVIDETRETNVRREMLKEVLFVVPPVAGAIIFALLPLHLSAWPFMPGLTGVLAGVLVGGGLIWATRIIGSLALGRVAMGLGDVPLMAAVGAVVGALPVTLAFFIAPFVALIWAVILLARKRPNVLPYGPWLVAAGILVLLAGRPILSWYLARLSPPHAVTTQVFLWPGEAAPPSSANH